MKFLFVFLVISVITFLIFKKKKNVIDETFSDRGIGQRELKELMELSRKSRQQPNDYENMVIGKFQTFLRDFSFESYKAYGEDMYLDAFYKRLNDIFQFLTFNPITSFPNRDAEIYKALDWVYKETGFAVINAQKNETVNVFHIGNLKVSIFLPDPKLNKILGLHVPQVQTYNWLTPTDILKNFLIPHPIKTFSE